MASSSRRSVVAILIVALLAANSSLHAQPPSTRPDLQQRIDSLQRRIDSLQRQEQSQTDVTASIAALLADADRHSAFMDAGAGPNGGGYDPENGFVLTDAAGNFLMHPSVLFQFRDESSFRQHIRPGGGEITGATGYDIDNGFETSRLRLTLAGNVFSPLLEYYFLFDADQGAPAGLLDAYVLYRVSSQSPLALKAGQFKDPLFHEKNLLPGNLLAVDRSLLDAYIGGGQTQRVQGGEMIYDEDRLRGLAAFHDGYNSGNTPFTDAGGLGTAVGAGGGLAPTNWGATARGEYLLLGDRSPQFNPFSEYDQFTALNARQDILVLGGALEYTESGIDKIVFHTVDAQFVAAGGFSAFAAYEAAYRVLPAFKGIRRGTYYDNGALVQAAYLIDGHFEPFVRYDYMHLDGQATPTVINDNLHEATIGANYYFHGQNLKLTLDATWLPNGCPTDLTGLGFLQNDGRCEFALRVQLQLAI